MTSQQTVLTSTHSRHQVMTVDYDFFDDVVRNGEGKFPRNQYVPDNYVATFVSPLCASCYYDGRTSFLEMDDVKETEKVLLYVEWEEGV